LTFLASTVEKAPPYYWHIKRMKIQQFKRGLELSASLPEANRQTASVPLSLSQVIELKTQNGSIEAQRLLISGSH